MGCINSTAATGSNDGLLQKPNNRQIARRLTINGPLGLDLEGSKYAVKDSNKNLKKKKNNKDKNSATSSIGNIPNYGEVENDGVQPSGGTKAIGTLPFLYGTCSRAGKKPSKRR